MGSKKLKRKKLKFKRIEKAHKLKSVKQITGSTLKLDGEKGCEGSLNAVNNTYNSSGKSYSLSCDKNEDFSEVKNFSKIREDYFIYLQTVISDNCAFYDSVVTEEMLKNLALELEQSALLACLQVDIYKKSMCKIIRDIKKSTEEKQVHEEVRKLLPDSTQEKPDNLKSEKAPENFLEVEVYSKIPTIASIRHDKELSDTNFWTEQSNYDTDYYLTLGQEVYNGNANENIISNVQSWEGNETFPSVPDHPNNQTSKMNLTTTKQSSINEFDNTEIVNDCQFSPLQEDVNKQKKKDKALPKDNLIEVRCEKVDPLLVSRSHLQKLVEQTLQETEKIQKQKRDEQERAYIAQILEGDDSLDDRFNDSLSDNENESKENIDETNLMDRLEKMRELFGVEEDENPADVSLEKLKPKINSVNSHSHRSNPWRYEKYIQLHKYSLIAREMSFERRNINRKYFLEMFGEDSDEEHETEYSSEEKYRSICAERISSWIVKYLMPFYHDKRILGRNVFKTLGHHISDTIVDEIQYPDEWTVKYFVSKFFPAKKKYTCDADILNFQLN